MGVGSKLSGGLDILTSCGGPGASCESLSLMEISIHTHMTPVVVDLWFWKFRPCNNMMEITIISNFKVTAGVFEIRCNRLLIGPQINLEDLAEHPS